MMNIDLTNIGIIKRNTFRDCTSLKSISVNDNSSTKVNCKATIDKNSIKQQCDKGLLKNIVLSNSLTAIGNNAFSGCKSLESVEISANVMRVGAEVFINCKNLKTVVFKDNTTGASMGKIVGDDLLEYIASGEEKDSDFLKKIPKNILSRILKTIQEKRINKKQLISSDDE